jgi:hypothetical protein
MRTATLLAAALALAACASAPNAEQYAAENKVSPLTAEELRAAFTNHSLTGNDSKSGGTYTIYYDANGEQRGTWANGADEDSDVGRWEVTDEGRLCSVWNKWMKAERRCFLVYPDSDGGIAWFKEDGSPLPDENEQLVEGNIAGL